jgi:hypothetical protein
MTDRAHYTKELSVPLAEITDVLAHMNTWADSIRKVLDPNTPDEMIPGQLFQARRAGACAASDKAIGALMSAATITEAIARGYNAERLADAAAAAVTEGIGKLASAVDDALGDSRP